MRWLKEPLPTFRRQRQGQRPIPGREAPLTAVLYIHDLPPLARSCLLSSLPPREPQAPHAVMFSAYGSGSAGFRRSQDLAAQAGLWPGQITRQNLQTTVDYIRRSWRAALSIDLLFGAEVGLGGHPSLLFVALNATSDPMYVRHLIASFQALGIRVVLGDEVQKTYGSLRAFIRSLEALERGIPGGSS